MTADAVGIVGGGPVGLTPGRILGDLGAPFTIFEAAADFGGLRTPDAEGTAIHDGARLISSRPVTGFDGFPIPEDRPDHPRHDLVPRCIRALARAAGLHDRARLGVSVGRAAPGADGWTVRLSDGTAGTFRRLVRCNGATRVPRPPRLEGRFDGIARHSSAHRSAADVAGKRVLVVGGGDSGADIACDAARGAARAAISLRRARHLIPRHVLGKPADVFAAGGVPMPLWLRQRIFPRLLRLIHGDMTKLGWPAPDHRLMESHPPLDDRIMHHLRHDDLVVRPDIHRLDGPDVVFADGTREPFDEIILATGCEWHVPCVPDDVPPMQGGKLAPPLRAFAPAPGGGVRDALFLLGFIKAAGRSIPLFHDMARVVARAIDARRRGAWAAVETALADEAPDLLGGLRMVGSDRHAAHVERGACLAALRAFRRRLVWPRQERSPPLGAMAR